MAASPIQSDTVKSVLLSEMSIPRELRDCSAVQHINRISSRFEVSSFSNTSWVMAMFSLILRFSFASVIESLSALKTAGCDMKIVTSFRAFSMSAFILDRKSVV